MKLDKVRRPFRFENFVFVKAISFNALKKRFCSASIPWRSQVSFPGVEATPAAEKNAKKIDGRVRAAIMAPLQKK